MPKRARSYRSAQQERLKDPGYAAEYVNAAIEAGDSAALLLALRNVAEAQTVNSVATQAGLSRESVYRMLSETGNPCYASLLGILGALGLQFKVQQACKPLQESEAPLRLYDTSLLWEVKDRPSAYFAQEYAKYASRLTHPEVHEKKYPRPPIRPADASEFLEMVA
jgi:probable addiction module antidote protein